MQLNSDWTNIRHIEFDYLELARSNISTIYRNFQAYGITCVIFCNKISIHQRFKFSLTPRFTNVQTSLKQFFFYSCKQIISL